MEQLNLFEELKRPNEALFEALQGYLENCKRNGHQLGERFAEDMLKGMTGYVE